MISGILKHLWFLFFPLGLVLLMLPACKEHVKHQEGKVYPDSFPNTLTQLPDSLMGNGNLQLQGRKEGAYSDSVFKTFGNLYISTGKWPYYNMVIIN